MKEEKMKTKEFKFVGNRRCRKKIKKKEGGISECLKCASNMKVQKARIKNKIGKS
jgi:hypothetical protein